MRIIIYLLILIFAFNAIARASSELASSESLALPKSAQDPVMFLVSTAAEGRLDQSSQKENTIQKLSNFSLGLQKGSAQILIEKSQFEELSGNSTLSVRRNFQDYMAWGSYIPKINSWSSLFVGGGLGGYQDAVETFLSGSSRLNKSSWKALAGFHFGIAAYVSVISASLEMRGLFGDEFDRQPQIAGVARIGLRF